MKKIVKNSRYIFLFIFVIILFMRTENYAASATIDVNSSVTVNTPITISVKGSGVQWNLQLKVDGTVIAESRELDNYESNKTISFSGKYTPTTIGNKTITLVGSVTEYSNGSTITNFTPKTLTVQKAPEPEPTPDPDPQPQPQPKPQPKPQPEEPTVITEPKFTNVNKIMYATGDINLRSSWSTNSSATEIKKGTELTITGTSTEKVNGYVWYRVSYKGATKYVASNLLTSTKPKEEEKSNNANLKSLTVEDQELEPKFSSAITSYTIKVAKDITKLELKAEPEDIKAKVTVQGNEQLKEGENNIVISVSAEDGTVKQYEIKAIRETETRILGLQSLKIKNTNIGTIFKPEQYDYEIEIKEETKLEIEAIANDEMATVEILGNEELQEGENVITIIVSSQDGTQKVTYQIKANKIANVTPSVDKQIDVQLYVYIAIGAILLIALIIVIVYTITHRNQEEYEYTDNIEELPEKREEQELEKTQEIKDANKEDSNMKEEEKEDKKPKIDYFIDKEETPKRKKGKHF